jgi:hypothetical protein
MNWHASADLPAPNETELSSLAVAFSNLLLKFDINTNPLSIRAQMETDSEPLDWAAITAIEPRLMPTSVGDHTSWPTDPNTVIRYSYIKENGQPAEHYCVVANPSNHTIVDSKDGKVQYSGIYGEPTAWASYTLVELDEDEPDIIIEEKEEENLKQRTGVLYKVMDYENVYTISTRYQLSVDDILSHNEITDPHAVMPGAYIYLPISAIQRDNRPVSYEILAIPRPMHVSHAGGAKKWSFGNVRSWRDIHDNGQHYLQNHNLMIVAIAHVPIEDETAAYYMDAVSFGNFKTTGLVRYTTGFNWQHLAEGHVYPEYTVDPVLDDEIIKNIEEAIEATKEVQAPEPVEVVEPPIIIKTASEPDFKQSYRPLIPGPVKYQAIAAMIITEAEGNQYPRPMTKDQPVNIAGTFEKDGVIYGLPAGAIKEGVITSWYQVPMDNLYIEDELYNTEVNKLSDKVALRQQLSIDEKMTVYIGRNIKKLERLKAVLIRKNK